MTVDEIIEKGNPITKNIENIQSTKQSAFLAGAAGYYTAGLNARLISADLHDANLGFFDRFNNFLVFGKIKALLDEFANKNNLVENILRLKIFETPEGPVQFFKSLTNDAKKQKASTKKAYDLAMAEVKSLFPGITELISIQIRQEEALKPENVSSESFTKTDRKKIKKALELNALAQELAITAVTGIHTQGMQEEILRNRKLKLIEEIQNDFNDKKPELLSSEYIKNIASSNFSPSDGYAFYVDIDTKTLCLIDNNGQVLTNFPDDLISIKIDGDKAFQSFEQFSQFVGGMINQTPEHQFNKYSKQLSNAKKENVKTAKESIVDSPENKTVLLNEIAKRNFELPTGFTIEVQSELEKDGENLSIEEAKAILKLPESEQLAMLDKFNLEIKEKLIVRDKEGEEISIDSIELKDKGDNAFNNFEKFEIFYINEKDSNIKTIVDAYTEHTNAKTENIEDLDLFLVNMQKKQIADAEKELANVSKRINELEKQAKEKSLITYTKEFNEYNDEIEFNKLAIDSLKYSLYNEILENYEAVLNDASMHGFIAKIKNREDNENNDRKKAIIESRKQAYFGDTSVIMDNAEQSYEKMQERENKLKENIAKIIEKNTEQLLYSTTCAIPIPQPDGSYQVYLGGGLDSNKMPSFQTMTFEEAKKWYAFSPTHEDGVPGADAYLSMDEENRKQAGKIVDEMTKQEFDNAIFFNELVHVSLPDALKTYNNFISQVSQIEKFKEDIDRNLEEEIAYEINAGSIIFIDNIYQRKDELGNIVPIFSEHESLVISTISQEEQQEILFAKFIPVKREALSNVRFNSKGEMLFLKEGEYKQCFGNEADWVDINNRSVEFSSKIINEFRENYLNEVIEKEELLAEIASRLAREEQINFEKEGHTQENTNNEVFDITQKKETNNQNKEDNIDESNFKQQADSTHSPEIIQKETNNSAREGASTNQEQESTPTNISQESSNQEQNAAPSNPIQQGASANQEQDRALPIQERQNTQKNGLVQPSPAEMSNDDMAYTMHIFHPSKLIAYDADVIVSFLKSQNISYKQMVKHARAFSKYYYTKFPQVKAQTRRVIVPRTQPTEQENVNEQEERADTPVVNQEVSETHEKQNLKKASIVENQQTNQESNNTDAEQIIHEVENPQEILQTEVDLNQEQTASKPVEIKQDEVIQQEEATRQIIQEKITEQKTESAKPTVSAPSTETKTEQHQSKSVGVVDASHSILKAYFADTAISSIKSRVVKENEDLESHNYNVAEEFLTWYDRTLKERGENLTLEVQEEIQQLLENQPLAFKRFQKEAFANIISGIKEMTSITELTPTISTNLINGLEGKFNNTKDKGKLEDQQAKNLILKDFQNTEILSLIDNDNFDASMQNVYVGMHIVNKALVDADDIRKIYLKKKQQALNKTEPSTSPHSPTSEIER